MQHTIFGRRGLSWALAAIMAVALPGIHSVWAVADGKAVSLLSSQLPAGVTLHAASIDQTCDAVHSATSQRPDLATSIVQVAIQQKSPRKGHGFLPCAIVKKIARAAMTAAPDRSSDIIQMALSLAPDCADVLDSLVPLPGDENAFVSPEDIYGGFGAGFGPGFPGSPGFAGSPPSGAVALPAPPVVTSVTNG